jgi:hypothetical protein
MGVDWYVSAAELVQGIPPTYAEFIGLHLMAHLTGDTAFIRRAFSLLKVPHSAPMLFEEASS